jgi:hypothetical protein
LREKKPALFNVSTIFECGNLSSLQNRAQSERAIKRNKRNFISRCSKSENTLATSDRTSTAIGTRTRTTAQPRRLQVEFIAPFTILLLVLDRVFLLRLDVQLNEVHLLLHATHFQN